jgi:hypothetical protein
MRGDEPNAMMLLSRAAHRARIVTMCTICARTQQTIAAHSFFIKMF